MKLSVRAALLPFLASLATFGMTADVAPAAAQIVINEIDYDMVGAGDSAEFVELKNVSAGTVNLSGYTLELVNGNGGGAAIYDTIVLPNVNLTAGDYYVICANAATVVNCDLDDGPDTDFIQNGSPDAVGLRLSGTLVDAVSYEGNTGALTPKRPGRLRPTRTPSLTSGSPASRTASIPTTTMPTSPCAASRRVWPTPRPPSVARLLSASRTSRSTMSR